MDDAGRTLLPRLAEALARHEVEIARGPFEAIYRIDCAVTPHDVIFCDLANLEVPGPELWAYLSLGNAAAAERMVFLASTPLPSETTTFLQRIPNACVELPADAEALDALVNRRATRMGPGLARRPPWDESPSTLPATEAVA